ncbi:MAG: sugar phosphate isomerase/epimerase family protein [Kiritimatiellia bacterium]
MIIGCFALMEPFTPIRRLFEVIRSLGFDYADLTDNHDGATLGTEYGFAASFSLDSHPDDILGMVNEFNLTLTSVCAHANLLDPASPARYGTAQIIKAIKLAHFLGVKQVITTEGDPKTGFGHNLTDDQRVFSVVEKLQEPIRWAKTLGIELLLEPHGILTDTVPGMQKLLDALGNEDVVGVNLDTGNSWLGGGDPHEFVKVFGQRIKHVHWKDMPKEMESQRGKMYGCGMALIPLGDGVVGIEALVKELADAGFDGPTTLEIAGEEAVKVSAERLRQWSA